MNGDSDNVRKILATGVKIDEEPTNDGYTSLHCAAQSGFVDIVALLLAAGCPKSMNCFDYVAHTPLMWAAQNGHYEIARILIEAGADLNANDESRIGDTAIRYAVAAGNFNLVKLLLDAGADPTIPGWMNVSALGKAESLANSAQQDSDAKRIYTLLKGAV